MNSQPQLLKKGDKVAIISTARKISLKEVQAAAQLFASWGLECKFGYTLISSMNQFAGTDAQRAADLQHFLDDREIKAIFCARGGYGTARILDSLDYTSFKENPKWIIGYSDVTALLNDIYFKTGIQSVHGIMPVNILSKESTPAVESLRKALFEGKTSMEAEPCSMNIEGKATGKIIGGNLSVLYSLLGSDSFLSTEDCILYIEDLDEYLYHIDRMVLALKRAGKFSKIKALVCGAFTKMHDNDIPFGKSAEEIILSYVSEYNIPVAFHMPFGHIDENNHAIINGKEATLTVDNDKVTLIQ